MNAAFDVNARLLNSGISSSWCSVVPEKKLQIEVAGVSEPDKRNMAMFKSVKCLSPTGIARPHVLPCSSSLHIEGTMLSFAFLSSQALRPILPSLGYSSTNFRSNFCRISFRARTFNFKITTNQLFFFLISLGSPHCQEDANAVASFQTGALPRVEHSDALAVASCAVSQCLLHP